jgi:hypothetical protein
MSAEIVFGSAFCSARARLNKLENMSTRKKMKGGGGDAALPLWERVQRVCDSTTGGRAVPQQGGWVVRVMDCPMWTVRATLMLRSNSPHALVSVEGCIASLSGFVVVVSERVEPPQRLMRIFMAVLVGLLIVLGGTAVLHGIQVEEDSSRASASSSSSGLPPPQPPFTTLTNTLLRDTLNGWMDSAEQNCQPPASSSSTTTPPTVVSESGSSSSSSSSSSSNTK